jgi:RimJ/RimL family protein N-acetyltransferase
MPFDFQPTLKSDLITLRPLRAADFDALYAVGSDPLIWEQHPQGDRYKPDVFRAFFDDGLKSGGALIAIDNATHEIIGSSRFHGYDPSASEIEIGWSFLARRYWGGRYNGEMKRLMLEHAFRFVDNVVFLIGEENMRSRRAVEKIGGVEIGMRTDERGQERVVYRITSKRKRSRRLLLRPYRTDDLMSVRDAIDESLPEVQQWLPWGAEEPSSLEHLATRLAKYATECANGTAWRLALVDADTDRFLGSGALLPFVGPNALEVGYWVRTSESGRGLATRVAAALTRYAFRERGVEHVELWMKPGHIVSAAVARRLGFEFREQREASRAGAAPQAYDIFTLPSLSDLRVGEDPDVRIELDAS